MQYAQNTENRGKQCLCGLQGISGLKGASELLVRVLQDECVGRGGGRTQKAQRLRKRRKRIPKMVWV